jgi:hypothetical protein
MRVHLSALAAAGLVVAAAAALAAAGCGSSGGVTYTKDVRPIFMAKCGSCHGGQGAGGQNIATTYSDTQRRAAIFSQCTSTQQTIGQCALTLIKDGTMPFMVGCSGNPTADASRAACTTQAQQDTIQAWIDAGLPES